MRIACTLLQVLQRPLNGGCILLEIFRLPHGYSLPSSPLTSRATKLESSGPTTFALRALCCAKNLAMPKHFVCTSPGVSTNRGPIEDEACRPRLGAIRVWLDRAFVRSC